MTRDKKVLWKRWGWMDVVNINGIYSLPELLDWCCGFVVVLHSLQHRMVPNPTTKLPHSSPVQSKGFWDFSFPIRCTKKLSVVATKLKIRNYFFAWNLKNYFWNFRLFIFVAQVALQGYSHKIFFQFLKLKIRTFWKCPIIFTEKNCMPSRIKTI